MGESIKASLGAVVVLSSIAAMFAWYVPDDTEIVWQFRVGAPIVAIVALTPILILHFRSDLAPDYLSGWIGQYFNRDGFCFSIVATSVDGIAYLDAYFQNQHANSSIGRIALRPSQRFTDRTNIEAVSYEIECGPAAFGVARLAIPVPREFQGKNLTFRVGASVRYPNGKGKRLRFGDGIFLRTNSNFASSFQTALTLVGAAAGMIVWSTPATSKITMPAGVANEIGDFPLDIRTLWRLGDAPLEKV